MIVSKFNMLLLISCFSLCMVTGLIAQNPTFPPRNEVDKDPALKTFVDRLKETIEKKDEVALLAAMDPEIVVAFDGEGGREAFKNYWKPEEDKSEVWFALKRAIELGGVFLQDTADHTGRYQFVFPYVYSLDLDMGGDYLAVGVITGKNVNLREKPDLQSKVIGKLSYEQIVYMQDETGSFMQAGLNEHDGPEWYKVETYHGGLQGWINWQFVYSPMGYRVFLYKKDNKQWFISAFLAGD